MSANPQGETGLVEPDFPAIWVGFLIAAASIALTVSRSVVNPDVRLEEGTPLTFLIDATGWGYWFFCVYRIHELICEATYREYPVTAARAVGYHFIPAYNVYWVFKWPNLIADLLKNKSASVRLRKAWPGFFLLIAILLGPVTTSVALTLAFGVLLRVVRKLRCVLRVPFRKSLIGVERRQALSLAASGGLGAGFCMCMYWELSILWASNTLEKVRALTTIALVSLAAILFLDPLSERLRIALGISEQHAATKIVKSGLFQIGVLFVVVLMTVVHVFLHGAVEHNPFGALGLLLVSIIIPLGTTYSWIHGLRHRRPGAARFGMVSGAALGILLILGYWVLLRIADHGKLPTEAWIPDLTTELGQAMLVGTGFRWGLVGLFGGLALDLHPLTRPSRRVAFSIILVSAAQAIMGLFLPQPLSNLVGLVVGSVGWSLGLVLHPSSDAIFAVAQEQA